MTILNTHFTFLRKTIPGIQMFFSHQSSILRSTFAPNDIFLKTYHSNLIYQTDRDNFPNI